jgi:hypothetical protein
VVEDMVLRKIQWVFMVRVGIFVVLSRNYWYTFLFWCIHKRLSWHIGIVVVLLETIYTISYPNVSINFHHDIGDERPNPRIEQELFHTNEVQTAGINFDKVRSL